MWGKILAGAAVGVGAVAAAPFTGGGSLFGGASLIASLSGAGAIAAATGAGVAGGVAGAVAADSDEQERRQVRDRGIAEGKAEVAQRLDNLQKDFDKAMINLKAHSKHFNAIIAMEAVAVSCAACDGDFSDNERQEIGEFVKGMMEQSIPIAVKEKIQDIYDNPPTIETAFALAEQSGIPLDVYEEMIKFVTEIDGVKSEEEVFIQAWNQLRAA